MSWTYCRGRRKARRRVRPSSRERAAASRQRRPAASRCRACCSRAASSSAAGATSSAASLGVRARTSAARSASVTSISWPTAETTGIREAQIARTTTSSLKAHRSSRLPPPRVTTRQSISIGRRLTVSIAAAISWAAPSPCTRLGTTSTSAPRQRRPSICRKSWMAAPLGLVTTAIRRAKRGRGRFRSGRNNPSRASRARSCRRASSRAPIPFGSTCSITNW